MNKLVEEYLTRAITERFEESLKEPDKCHSARDIVIRMSLSAFRKTKGREGIGSRTIVRALEMAIDDLEAARAEISELNAMLKHLEAPKTESEDGDVDTIEVEEAVRRQRYDFE